MEVAEIDTGPARGRSALSKRLKRQGDFQGFEREAWRAGEGPYDWVTRTVVFISRPVSGSWARMVRMPSMFTSKVISTCT